MPLALAAPDYLVMLGYGALVVLIGTLAHRRQKSSEDYFLGGRRLPWWVVGVSLMATSFSSVSLIAGTGFGFAKGLGWLQLQIGDLVALVAVCLVFLPFFSGLRLTTAYEYLERRFGVWARSAASALFLFQTLLRAGLLVYSPALALTAILRWPIEVSIVVAAGAAILYSAFGGIGAVVWTDLVQLLVILIGVGACLVLVLSDVPGGLSAVLDWGRENGRLRVVSLSVNPRTQMNLLGSLVPYAVFAFSLFGTGQPAVQRFLSVKDLGSARRAALTGWAVGTGALALTLFLGVCIGAWVGLGAAPGGFPADAGDRALPFLIEWRLPAGLAGLLLAAVFAASMSSMDSAIHSMSTAFVVDFQRRFRRSGGTPAGDLLTARWTTVAIGVLSVIGALVAAHGERSILETLVTWLGYFAGPLLGLFLLGLLSTRATEAGALVGVALAAAAVLVAVGLGPKESLGVHPLWLAPFSTCVTFLAGLLASLAAPAPARARLEGLTMFTRTAGGPRGAGRPGDSV